MVSNNQSFPLQTISPDIQCFLNGSKILKLNDFVSIEEEIVGYVIGCFYGVAQGIDFMIDEKNNLNPRLLFCIFKHYSLRIK
jgi:hypothetical protein